MSSQLLIRIIAHSNDVEWVLTGSSTQGSSSISTSPIPPLSEDTHIVVIVPGDEVFLTTVHMPKMSHTKLLKAIPYALEDQLAEDVQYLHFAISEGSGPIYSVAVVNKALMKEWLDKLKNILPAGKLPYAFVPESLLLPMHHDGWTVFIDNNRSVVRMGELSGFVTDSDNLVTVLRSFVNTSSTKPLGLDVYTASESSGLGNQQLEELEIPIKYYPMISLLHSLAASQHQDTINLLQGEFSTGSGQLPTKRLWRYSTILTACCLTILTVNLFFKYSYLSGRVKALDAQVFQVYKTLFPNATVMVSPKERVERLLKEAKTSEQAGGFFRLLNSLSPILSNTEHVDLDELIFGDQQMQISLEANDFSDLDVLTKSLTESGLKVEQKSANKSGNKIRALLILRETI